MSMLEEGRERGRRAGSQVEGMIEKMQTEFVRTRELYPTIGDMDLAAAIREYDRERLACEPDYGVFPEMKGLLDRHVGEREGFREASGLDETATAYQFSWGFFLSRRLTANHLARYDLVTPWRQCTNVFFPEGEDGVTISNNRDDTARPVYAETIPNFRKDPVPAGDQVHWRQGGVSSAVLLDEEPECCFPCDPIELVPDECLGDIHEIVKFMTRYREFYGPGNQMWCDRSLNAVAVEKTNCRVAFRWPTVNGAVCITACSYLDPELNAFKKERTRRAMAIKGEAEENSVDWHFFRGADRRHRRLIELTNAEAKRGATLWGAFNVVADTAVPFPDRICVAGEKAFPEREPNANWTLTQYASVITGPNRRTLYRSIRDFENLRSITTFTPYLVLGEGVEMKPEWQRDIDRGLCELAPPLDSEK